MFIRIVFLYLSIFIVGTRGQHLIPKNTVKSSVRISESVNDEICDSQIKAFSSAFDNREHWAMRLFDTWAKVTSGYLVGNRINFGHFTECLNFRHVTANAGSIQGQHCFVTFTSTTPSEATSDGFDWREIGGFMRNYSLTLTNSFCLPASCSEKKVIEYVNGIFQQADLIPLEAQCLTNDPISFNVVDILAIVLFSLFGIIFVLSTVYDVLLKKYSMEPNKLLIAFSAYTNGKKLFDVSRSKSPDSINCLHGLRAVSAMWIIFGHRFYLQQMSPLANPAEVREHYDRIYSAIFSSNTLAVDTFFIMGALLVTWSTLRSLDKGTLKVPRMIWRRYLRYSPVFAMIILFAVSLNRFFVSGPIINDVTNENCQRFWWSALLHVQNYVNANEMCLGHAWYLSADFQLFILSPFLIYPAWKWGRKYIWSLGLLAFMSSIYILIMSLVYEIHVTPRSAREFDLYFRWIYFATHARMGPWLVGIILGYVLYKHRNEKVRINRALDSVLWIVALSILVATVVGIQPLFLNFQSPLIGNAIFLAFHRLGWAIGVSWIIFACQNLKSGGIVRWFLSLSYFQPIGKMGLSMWLIHYMYQQIMIMNQRQPLFFEIWPMMHVYFGDIFVTICIATVLFLVFEEPFLLVEDYFYKKFTKKTEASVL